MATTPIYGFETPDDTDLVKDGALAIRTALDDVDSTLGTALNSKLHAGLVLIKSQTLASVSSVTITNAFSATYDAYRIVFTGLTTSGATGTAFQLGTNNTNYYSNQLVTGNYSTASGTVTFQNQNNTSSYDTGIISTTTNATGGYIELQNPFDATTTAIEAFGTDVRSTDRGLRFNAGYHNVSSSFTSFTFLTAAPTFTGGRISVYGYAKD